MRLYDGIRVLAVTGTIAASAAPAAQALPPMQPSGGIGPAEPVITQQSDGSPDWVLIGAGAGAVVLIGGVAATRRTSSRAAHSRGSGVAR
jgi:hypothetical protein